MSRNSPLLAGYRMEIARLGLIAIGWLSFMRVASAQEAPLPVPLELRPYRVRIDVAFELQPDFSREFRDGVLRDLRDGLDRSAGALFEVELAEDHNARRAGLQTLARLSAERIPDDYETTRFDKVYLLTVESTGGGYRTAGREWDAQTLQLGPLQSRTFPDRDRIAGGLLELLQSLFRPQAAVEQVKNGPPMLRARAGALIPRDEGWQPLRPGRMFEAYYRYLSKDLLVERIQRISWTYLSVGTVASGLSECTLASGLRISFVSRRRRVEPVALGIDRSVGPTRLTLVTPFPIRRPLGGVEVEVFAAPPALPDENASPSAEALQRLVTDRNGQVFIGSSAQAVDKPLWLSVRSGQNLLARIPFVPGIRSDELLELPDDTLRLEIEGQVAQLQSELVDAVARRAVVSAMLRNRAKLRDWLAVDDLLKQLAVMPTDTTFTAELNAIRVNALKRAKERKDKLTELRVQKLCDEAAELIANYLDEAKLNELRDEIRELKQIAAEEAADEAEAAQSRKAAPTRRFSVPNPAAEPQAPLKPAAPRPGF